MAELIETVSGRIYVTVDESKELRRAKPVDVPGPTAEELRAAEETWNAFARHFGIEPPAGTDRRPAERTVGEQFWEEYAWSTGVLR